MFLFLLVPKAQAQSPSPRIVNGLHTSDFPTTGALLYGNSASTAETWCSGTLIGCNTFLTAAHCVEGDPSPSRYFVFLQHAGTFAVTSVDRHPSYNFPVADVAVIKLASPVNGIRPTVINTVQKPAFGTPGTIAGFGRSGGSSYDYGLKRYGAVTTSSCAPSGESNSTSVCWKFDSPQGPAGSNSNTCNGDSGGPLFLTLGGNQVVAGVTSGGLVDSCLTGDVSFDSDVFVYSSFIQSKGGSDLESTSCGSLPQIGDNGADVVGFTGSVSGATPDAIHSIEVTPGTDELRVTMNAVDDGSDFDLYVKRGSAPTTGSYDCAQVGANQFGVCTFNNPAADTWYVMVHRYSGAGTYQLTVTSFGGGCADPINDGQSCDDQNPCTSGDVCSGLSCQGTVVEDGTVCSAGSLCSGPGLCDAGACKVNVAPATSCKQTLASKRSMITVKSARSNKSNMVKWKWKGEETSDFGNPTFLTDYAFCVYDESGSTPVLIVEQSIPAGQGWVPTARGYKYSDSSAVNDGVRSIKLQRGSQDRALIQLLARGVNVSMPALPLQQDTKVLVQLVADENRCWEARYSASSANSSTLFRAKSD